MRDFTENEIEIIKKLIEAASQKSVTIQQILKSFYLMEALGRGLIIHNQANYAVLFLKKDLYEDEETRGKEINSFLELVSLLNYLSRNGYINIYKYKTDEFYFIQDGFNVHKRVGNDILLNSKGYCTPNIETIIDGNKNVIYKGTVFRGDNYELVSNMTTGNLFVSEQINELIEKSDSETLKTEAAKKTESDISNKSDNEILNRTEALKINYDKLPPVLQKRKTALGEMNNKKKESINERGAIKQRLDKIQFITAYFVGALLFILLCYFAVDSYIRIKSLEDKVGVLESTYKDLNRISNSRHSTAMPSQTVANESSIYGIDLSKWNGDIENELEKVDKISFVVIRATEGEKGKDNKFDLNWKIARNKGLIVGAYHFFRVDEDPFAQAENFFNSINSIGKIDIVPAVDIEMGSISKNKKNTPSQVQSTLLSFLYHLERKINRKPMIYTDLSFADQFLLNRYFADYPLWLAEYSGTESPKIPKTWKESGFKIWQKKDNYSLHSQHTDFDVFNGSKQDLIK